MKLKQRKITRQEKETSRTSYKMYRASEFSTLSLDQYAKFTNVFNKYIAELLLSGAEVELPAKVGKLMVKGSKIKYKVNPDGTIEGLAPDFKRTKELWETCPECKENKQHIYHTNDHTSGHRYRFVWSKLKVFSQNKTLYNLTMTRHNKRELAKRIFAGAKYYIAPEKGYENFKIERNG